MGETRITIADGSLAIRGIRCFSQNLEKNYLLSEYDRATIQKVDIRPFGAHIVRGRHPYQTVRIQCDVGVVQLDTNSDDGHLRVSWRPLDERNNLTTWKIRRDKLSTPTGKIQSVTVDDVLTYNAEKEKVHVQVWYKAGRGRLLARAAGR